jgi:hypothetical protein
MSDVAWGVMLLTGVLWVVGPFWQWRRIPGLEQLVAGLRRSLGRAQQPAKTAEINVVPEQKVCS